MMDFFRGCFNALPVALLMWAVICLLIWLVIR
jgi:hypothetical protein